MGSCVAVSLGHPVTAARGRAGLYADGRLEPPIYMFVTAVRDEHGSHLQEQFFEDYLHCDMEERTDFLKNCERIAVLIAEFLLVEGLVEG